MHQPVNSNSSKLRHAGLRLFHPILAGATLRDRLIGCLGALIGIGLTALICGIAAGQGLGLPLIVAPMGASAVLLFAVPASPLAQPWPIIGGNTISALVGISVAQFIHDPVPALAVSAALAIGVMSFTRCLHPPGGAAALTAVLGGPVVAKWGLLFPLMPVALNSCILVGLGLMFHKLARRSYPHVVAPAPVNTHNTADIPPQARVGFREEDVDSALDALDETFDIDRADLSRLLWQVELQASIRSHRDLTCDDIMSRDVISIDLQTKQNEALSLLLKHNIRTLPVRDERGRLTGTVGLRELLQGSGNIAALKSPASIAFADDPVMSLLPILTDGQTHAVIIIDRDAHIKGLISQTDLMSAVARTLAEKDSVA